MWKTLVRIWQSSECGGVEGAKMHPVEMAQNIKTAIDSVGTKYRSVFA